MDQEFLQRIPAAPGVYLMKDKKGRVIYVGKAKDLRARVRAYFRPGGGDERAFVATGLLGKLLGDVETVVVNNEKEALLLENNLIKEHQPRFNVKLTDDKNYLVLRIDPKKAWPRVEVTRKIQDDGAQYFGPYHSATSCRETLRLVNRHFQLRTCTDHVLATRKRPCILYQIKRCPAPCVYDVDAAGYGEQVSDVALFLGGKKDELVPRLRDRMKEYASRMEYERAGQLRDQIAAVESTLVKQTVVSGDFIDQDVFGTYRRDDVVELVVMFMRQGKLLGRRAFRVQDQEVPDEEVLRNFVRSYYQLGSFIPDEVLLPEEIDDREAFAEWLGELRGKRVAVFTPRRGDKVKLLELAAKNAEASWASRKNKGEDALASLEKLAKRLSLKRLPRRIECFDIAHIQGSATVASMVVFMDGEPSKAHYRKFKVKTVANDDFGSMYEVLSRRFRRARDGGEGWEEPDLLIVDGGKGQLNTALAALADLGIEITAEKGFDVIGLAKERPAELEKAAMRAKVREAVAAKMSGAAEAVAAPAADAGAVADVDAVAAAEAAADEVVDAATAAGADPGDAPSEARPDRVYLRNAKDAIKLRSSSTELFLLSRIRDEAHRVANSYHRQLRKSRTLRSALEDVPGVGATRKKLLLRHFGSLKRIKDASVDEIAAVPGVGKRAATAIKQFFGPGK